VSKDRQEKGNRGLKFGPEPCIESKYSKAENPRKFGPESYLEESAAELAWDGVNYVGAVGAGLQKSKGLGFRV
jgi:hypothetical protein